MKSKCLARDTTSVYVFIEGFEGTDTVSSKAINKGFKVRVSDSAYKICGLVVAFAYYDGGDLTEYFIIGDRINNKPWLSYLKEKYDLVISGYVTKDDKNYITKDTYYYLIK